MLIPVLLCVLAGFLTRAGFPEPGWWPCAVLGVGLWFLVLIGRRGYRFGAVLGLVYGLAVFAPLLHWSGVYVGAGPWLALSLLQAAYVALLGAVLPRVLARVQPSAAVGATAWAAVGATATAAALFTAQEALRARTPFGGFPWGRLAFSQADSPLGHLAAWGGAPLVTFATAWAGALLAWGVLAACRGSGHRGLGRLRHPGIAAPPVEALFAAALATGVLAVGLAVPLPTSGRSVRVAAVQGDVPQAGLEFNAERRAVLDNHVRGTRELAARVAAGAEPRPDLVLWPENASDIDPYRQADARAAIDGAVDAIGVPTLVGTVLNQPVGRLTNASIVWRPGIGPGASYAKRHPVPFGEYIPYRSFFRRFSDKVDLVRTDFVGGERVGTLPVGPARAGVTICFEVAYDDLVRDTVTAGADLLVVQTNNATFGETDEAAQQLAMSRLRAVEHGRAVAHVSTVGISALILPDGTEVARTALFTPAVLAARLPLRTPLTVSDRLGGAPEAAIVLGGLIGVVLLGRSRPGGGRRRGWRGGRPGEAPAPEPIAVPVGPPGLDDLPTQDMVVG
jgi:apolipoprotein N-acyltransferase